MCVDAEFWANYSSGLGSFVAALVLLANLFFYNRFSKLFYRLYVYKISKFKMSRTLVWSLQTQSTMTRYK